MSMAGSEMVTYDLNSTKKGSEAQKAALRSRQEKRNELKEGKNQVAINDSTTQSVKAEQRSVGFFGWFKRLFSDKVDFSINGTQITGKNGYQARGGVVPLFSGAVLDLIPADLTARVDNENEDQLATGTGAKLVVAPTNKDFMIEILLDEVTVRKTKSGNEIITGQAKKSVEIEYENNKKLKGEDVNITDAQNIEFISPTVITANGTEAVQEAIINESGLQIIETSTPANREPERPESAEETAKTAETEGPESGYELPEFELENYKTALSEFLSALGIKNDMLDKLLEKEDAEESSTEDNLVDFETNLSLVSIPILPLLSFNFTLTPSLKLGYGYKVNAHLSKPTKPEEDYSFTLSVQAGICGSMGLELALGIIAGNNAVFGASADIVAYGTINGTAQLPDEFKDLGGDNPLLLVGGGITLEGKEGLTKGDASLKLSGSSGFDIHGGVKAKAGLKSEIFDWEQSLGEYTFADWTLLTMSISQDWTKNLRDGKSLFSFSSWDSPGKEVIADSIVGEVGSRKGANYGLKVINKQEEAVNALLAKESVTMEQFEVLSNKITAITNAVQNLPSSMNVTSSEQGAYDILMDKLFALEEKTLSNLKELQVWSVLNSQNIGKITKESTWKNVLIGCNEKMEAHSKRIDQLKAWGDEWEKSTKSESKDAYVAFRYMDKYGGKGIKSGLKDEIQVKAEEEIGTKDRILAFENSTMEEKTKKHKERLEMIQNMSDLNVNLEESPEAVDAYMEETNSKNILNFLGDYSQIDKIIAFETEGRDKDTKSHRERVDKMKKKQAASKIKEADLEFPNEQFAQFYMNDLGGTAFRDQMFSFKDANGNGALTNLNVASVMVGNFSDNVKKHAERIRLLEGKTKGKKSEEEILLEYNKKTSVLKGGAASYMFEKNDLYNFLQTQIDATKIDPLHYKDLDANSLANYFKIEDIQNFIIGANTGIKPEINTKFAGSFDIVAYCQEADLIKKIKDGKNKPLNKMFLKCYKNKNEEQLTSLKTFDAGGSKNIFDVWNEYIKLDGIEKHKDLLNKKKDKKVYGISELLSYEKMRIREVDKDQEYSLYQELIAESAEEMSDEHRMRLINNHEKIAKILFKSRAQFVTPKQLFQYEEDRMNEKSKNHVELLAYLNDCVAKNMEYSDVIEGYRERVRGQRSIYENLAVLLNLTSDNTAFDADLKKKYKKDANVRKSLTMGGIKSYEEKRVQDISSPFNQRIAYLNNSKGENFSSTGELGKMNTQFFNKHNKEIKAKKEEIVSAYYSYQKILDYESQRVDFYQKKKDRASNIVVELTNQQVAIDQSIKKVEGYKAFFQAARENKKDIASTQSEFKQIGQTIAESNSDQIDGVVKSLEAAKNSNKDELQDVLSSIDTIDAEMLKP